MADSLCEAVLQGTSPLLERVERVVIKHVAHINEPSPAHCGRTPLGLAVSTRNLRMGAPRAEH